MAFVAGKEPFTFLNINSPRGDDPSDSQEISPPDVHDDEFQAKVIAAYDTLPPTIRALPDFPPIEILDEPMQPMPGHETLGSFFGLSRSKKLTFTIPGGPTVIHIYRGPVLRSAARRGIAIEQVLKTTVWHEVAHWLGHNEEDMAELGLR